MDNGIGPSRIIISYDENGEHNISWIYSDCPEYFKKHLEENNITDYVDLGPCGDPKKWAGIPSEWEINNLDDIPIHELCPVSKKLVFCKHKAKKRYVDKMRQSRNALLQKLDGEYMAALEKGASTSEILEKKKKLRDMPTNEIWDECNTKEDFECITLDRL